MVSFEYYAPQSLEEALSILNNQGNDAKVLAGGTDLIVQMKDGRLRPSVIVDVKRLPELNRLEWNNHTLYIGAAIQLSRIVAFPAVRERFGMLYQACNLIGSMQLRNRATIGGNICNAAPSADTAPSLLCLGAKAIIARTGATRLVPMESFFRGPGETVVEHDELLMGIEIPAIDTRWAGYYLRHTPRQDMDISVASVASLLILDKKENQCREARIALGAVAPIPIRVPKAESELAGQMLTSELIEKVAEIVEAAAQPISDVRGSAKYRIELVKVLFTRTFQKALETLAARNRK